MEVWEDFIHLTKLLLSWMQCEVTYPNLITAKDSIGASVQGRTIWAVKISDNPDVDEDEPEIFYNSLIHANEVAGMMSVIYFMYYLLENYGSDAEVTYLVNNREFYFIPVINPDGNTYNQQISPNGGGMWRKNLRDNNNDGLQNEYDGVDLAKILVICGDMIISVLSNMSRLELSW